MTNHKSLFDLGPDTQIHRTTSESKCEQTLTVYSDSKQSWVLHYSDLWTFLETNYSDNFLWIASIVTSRYEHHIVNLVSFVLDRNFLKSGSWHSKPQIFNTKNCDSEYVVTLKCCVILVWHLQHFHIFSWQLVDIRRSILVAKKEERKKTGKSVA